uniref:Uncharacterized protein n=1 Tax=viral metagenome TaxID=1070528 RepID=A0A6C0IJ27_9ZZZZ
MTCEAKESSCYLQKPVVLTLVIAVGGISSGYFLFPVCNDDSTPYNAYIRKVLILGGTLAGGFILAKHLIKENKCGC